MRLLRGRLKALTVALAVGAGLAAAGSARAADMTDIKVGISAQAITVLPLYMAEAGGFFKDNGLKVEIINTSGGSRGLKVLLSGQIQAMHVGLGPVVLGNTQGAGFRLVLASANSIPFTIYGSKGITEASQLKGGKVGISSFSSESDIAVTLALEKMGLSRKDVTVVQLGGSSKRLAALLAGQVKAAPLIQPGSMLADEQGLKPLFDLAKADVPWIFDALVVNQSYLKDHRDVVMRLSKAYLEGAYLALSDKKKAFEVIAKHFRGKNPKVAEASYSDFKRLMPLDGMPSRSGAENVIKQLAAIGKKVGSKNVDDYVDFSIVNELKKDGFVDKETTRFKLK